MKITMTLWLFISMLCCQHLYATPNAENDDQCVLAVVCLPEVTGLFSCPEEVPRSNTNLIVVTSSCGTPVVRARDFYSGTVCPGNPLIITRQYTVTDDIDTVICTQIFTVVDDLGPIIENVPDNLITDCNNIPAVPSNLFAYDNCGGSSAEIFVYQNETTIPGACAGTYTIIRDFTATDDCGNTSTASYTIEVIDDTPPVIANIPVDATVSCDAVPTAETLTATDDCGGNLVATVADIVSNDCAGSYIITRVWTATDACGNTGIAEQVLTVVDDINPVFDAIPSHTSAPCDAIPDAPTVTATDNCSAATVSMEENISPIGSGEECANNYILTRTWTATDACGNTSQASQTIAVFDLTAPVLSDDPADMTVECDAVPTATTLTATDNCTSNVVVSMEETTAPIGDCANSYILTRTWTATDECGNTSEAVQTITVSDSTPPTLSSNPADMAVECDAVPTAPTLTATDNCSTATVSMEESITPIGSGDDCAANYILTRTWTATDECGNTSEASQTITVFDTTPPTLSSYPADITVSCNEEVPTAPTLTATDNCGTASISFSEDNELGCGENGIITRTWTAVDECMNETIHVQTILLSSTLIVDCPADITVACSGSNGSIVEWETPKVTAICDDTEPTCGPESIPGFIYLGEFNDSRYYCSGTSNFTWTGANASAIQNGGHLVVINDAAENSFIANSILAPRVWIGLNDANSEGNFEWSNGDAVGYTNFASGQPDNYNNQDYTMFRADGYDIWYDFENEFLAEFVMEIPCEGGSVGTDMTQVTGPANGSTFPEGTTAVAYEYVNACGLVETCSFNVTVEECCAIDLECPSDITIDCNSNGGAYVTWSTPTATSYCQDICPAETYIAGHIYLGEHNGHRYYCSSASNFNWTQANAAATANGGNLVVINDAQENAFITNAVMAAGIWLGINDAENEGTFEWVNGDPVSYDNWASGEPNNFGGNQDYGYLNANNGNWYDRNIGNCYEYVMEIPCGLNVEQVAGPQNGSFLPAGSTQSVSYIVSDNAGFSESCTFNVSVEDCAVDYCDAYASSCYYFWIDQVKLGDINNYSGASSYSDFTYISSDLTAGCSYPMKISPDFYNYYYNNYYYVFIDFNQDGDFDDPNEYVLSDYGYSNVYGDVYIPNSAANGATRMRVVMSYYCIDDPCGYVSYGEVEDYTVNIINNGNTRTATVEPTTPKIPLVSEAAAQMEDDRLIPVQGELNVYPNPATDFVKVDFISAYNEEATLQLRNLLGQTVLNQAIRVTEGENTAHLDLPKLPSGNYLLYLEGSTEQRMKAIIIK